MADYDRAKHLELISRAIERMDKSATSPNPIASCAWRRLSFSRQEGSSVASPRCSSRRCMYYWYTDAQYLGRERAFRRLYDQVRKAELDDDSYVMDIGGLYGQSPVWHCMRLVRSPMNATRAMASAGRLCEGSRPSSMNEISGRPTGAMSKPLRAHRGRLDRSLTTPTAAFSPPRYGETHLARDDGVIFMGRSPSDVQGWSGSRQHFHPLCRSW